MGMTQKQGILAHLKEHKSITPIEALNKFGCFRLSAIIFELREEGHNISTDINEGKKKYAIYSLVEEDE